MTPAYLKDMQIIDERLTALEDKLNSILKILVKLEEVLLCKREFTKERKEKYEQYSVTSPSFN